MKYISLDIETTGLDPDTCQVLQIGAVLEDTENPLPLDELPSFNVLVRPDGPITGDAYALRMNAGLIARIANGEGWTPAVACSDFKAWVWKHGRTGGRPWGRDGQRITLAGKNVRGFDPPFPNRLAGVPGDFHYHREMGRTHFWTPVTVMGIGCRLLLEKKK